jgi:ATP phosphoribosyltransferase regulatory subunit HisZ
VRKAYERHQNLTAALDKYVLEIDSVNAIVSTIVDEDALQTASVASELTKLCTVGTKLMKCLKELDPGDKGIVRQLAHQLVHGTKEEETLADIMADLDRAKADLSLRVQLANVGLTRMVHDTVLANIEVINRIDRLLAEVLGEGHGLKLAGLLEDMHPQGSCNGITNLLFSILCI